MGKLLVRFCEGRGGNQVMVLVTPSPKAPRLLDPADAQYSSSVDEAAVVNGPSQPANFSISSATSLGTRFIYLIL
ncbi:MAG: hypothetical protein M3Q91_04985, partial [Acidobacteriota bacterium]|nr:hypothetical protein [Acidobacteriota bacterium]